MWNHIYHTELLYNNHKTANPLKRLFQILLMILILPSTMHAQRIVRELETNSDQNISSQEDSLQQENDDDKIVPVDVRSWTINEIFGNMIPAKVDTLSHQYQNNNLTEGLNGHYNHLGNLGSPRLSRIFMERKSQKQFMFISPYDMFFVEPENFRFYNTKSPFTNLSYNFCGTKTTGDDHFKALFTTNAGKDLNIGGNFDYMYGQGYYGNQSTSFMNGTGFASYTGEKYNLHFYYSHNSMKMAENGGIEDDTYITNPEDIANSFTSNDIPTVLTNSWNKQENDVLFLNHRYNLGFYKEVDLLDSISDSTLIKQVFVPVTSIFHSFKLESYRRRYYSYGTPDNYFTNRYLDGDTINDKTTNFSIRNTLGISLREGFNKWAAAGISAFIGYEHRRFELPDTLSNGRERRRNYNEGNLFVGGQILRTQGRTLHYNIDGDFSIAGEDIGQFRINGEGELNFKLLKDTARLNLKAYVKNENPGFYYRHYHSQNTWWDKDLDYEFRTRVEGAITIERTRTKLSFGIENIQNYTYFENNGGAYTTSDGNTKYSNNINVRQHTGSLQVISANLRQDFKLGIFHLDNDITYQISSNKDVLPLPTLSLYHNLYIKFKIAKVLKCELGADLKFFTEYYAPDYAPSINQFTNQNSKNKIKIGNYPIISAYANFDLKRTRFYIMYYHANQSAGNYFWAPHYPINPACLRFGLSWNFYD